MTVEFCELDGFMFDYMARRMLAGDAAEEQLDDIVNAVVLRTGKYYGMKYGDAMRMIKEAVDRCDMAQYDEAA